MASTDFKSQRTDVSSQEKAGEGYKVYVHVYDLGQQRCVQNFNSVLWYMPLPLKVGGIFHVGIEVNSHEVSFAKDGIHISPFPRMDREHHYRETICLHKTYLDSKSIRQLTDTLEKEYNNTNYHVLHRNCCHFADDFCQCLGAGRIPSWVWRFARAGSCISCPRSIMMPMVQSVVGTVSCTRTGTEVELGDVFEHVDFLVTHVV